MPINCQMELAILYVVNKSDENLDDTKKSLMVKVADGNLKLELT